MSIDGILTTTGVTSEVFNDSEELEGHILLADYDSTDGCSYDMMLEDIINLDGITVLLESSKNSYHVWNLTVRGEKEALAAKADLHDDAKHLKIGWRRGRWTLRLTGKHSIDGSEYKSAPQIRRVIGNATDKPQSEAHFKLLKALAEKQEFDLGVSEDSYEFTGAEASTEQYMTVVDDLKDFGGSED